MQNKYFHQIDGLRALAVILVMFSHWTDQVTFFQPLNRLGGGLAVDVFFVLSGFLISLILMKAKYAEITLGKALKLFYIRRFLRIFPLYYLMIAIGVIFKIAGARTNIVWLSLYLVNFKMSFFNGSMGWFPHTWTLSVEEQFYLFFPLLILTVPVKHIKTLAWALIIIGITSRTLGFTTSLSNYGSWFTYSFTTCCLDSFGFGALLANYFYKNPDELGIFLSRYKYLFISAGLAGVIMFCLFNHPLTTILFRLLNSIFAFWVIGMASTINFKGLFGKILINKRIIYLGRISYGIYVYHYLMFYIFRDCSFSNQQNWTDLLLRISIYSICTITFASLSFYFFERPINNLKKHFEYNSN